MPRLLLAAGALLCAAVAAQPASSWLAARRDQAQTRLEASRSAWAKARAAAEQAQARLAAVLASSDPEAQKAAVLALDAARRAEAAASRRAKERETVAGRLAEAAAWVLPGGKALGIPVLLEGNTSADLQRPLAFGEAVGTGPASRLLLFFPDGSELELGAETEFRCDDSPEGLRHTLLSGRLQVSRSPAAAVAGLAGRLAAGPATLSGPEAEFSLAYDELSGPRLSLRGGSLKASVAEGWDRSKLKPWWSAGPVEPVPAGGWALVEMVHGEVRVLGPAPRPGRSGELLRPGEALEVAKTGAAWLSFPDGSQGWLGEGSRLSLQGRGRERAYALAGGRAWLSAREGASMKLLTPAGAAAGRGELAVAVPPDGIAEYTLLEGSFTLAATASTGGD